MHKADFIALINPAMTLAIAVALFILWNYRRDRRYIAVLCGAYATLSAGFLLEYLLVGLVAPSAKLLTNMLLVVGVCMLVSAVAARYRLRPPIGPMMVVCLIGVSAFTWYLYVDPNRTARMLIINYLAGAMLLVLAWRLRDAQDKHVLDRAIIGFLTVWGLEMFVRTSIVIWLEAPYALTSISSRRFTGSR